MFFGFLSFSLIWFLPWRFQTNDDVMMLWLVSGAYTGEPESFAVFIHPFLSFSFSVLYTWFPDFNWYAALWFCLIFLSYSSLVIACFQSSMHKNWKIIWLTILLIFCIHLCFFQQFTHVAGLTGFSGLVLLFNKVKVEVGKRFFILGWALVIFSLLIRWEAFSVIAFGIGLCFLTLRINSEVLKNKRKLLLLGGIFIFLVGYQKSYEIMSEYAEYMKFDKARASVIDHPVFREMIFEDEIEKGTTIYYFSNWIFDEGKVSIDFLKAQKELLDNQFFTLKHLKNSFFRLYYFHRIDSFKTFLCLVCLSLFLVSFKEKKLRASLFLVSWIGILFAMNFFLTIPTRVSILFFFIFLLPPLYSNSKSLPGYPIVLFILLSFSAYHFIHVVKIGNFNHQIELEFKQILVSEQNRKVPVLTQGLEVEKLKTFFVSSDITGLISLSWNSRSPFQKKAFQKLGLNKLSEAKQFVFIARKTHNLDLIPSYMKMIGGDYRIIKSSETENFEIRVYEK